jgi:hypothetical protein
MATTASTTPSSIATTRPRSARSWTGRWPRSAIRSPTWDCTWSTPTPRSRLSWTGLRPPPVTGCRRPRTSRSATCASGRELAHLEFYLGLGYFKIAVIAEGIYARHLRGLTRGTGFDHVGEAVAPLVAAGLRALAQGL